MNRPYRKKMTSGCIQCIDGGPLSGSAAEACRCASFRKIIIGHLSDEQVI